MKIDKIMSSDVVTITMDDPIKSAKDIFEKRGFHHLLVIEDGKLFGVLSDRDLLKAISPNVDSISATTKDLATLEKRVHQIMSREPIYLQHGAKVKDAVRLFNEHKISCIPVVDAKMKPVGILSWRDIMKQLLRWVEKREHDASKEMKR